MVWEKTAFPGSLSASLALPDGALAWLSLNHDRRHHWACRCMVGEGTLSCGVTNSSLRSGRQMLLM